MKSRQQTPEQAQMGQQRCSQTVDLWHENVPCGGRKSESFGIESIRTTQVLYCLYSCELAQNLICKISNPNQWLKIPTHAWSRGLITFCYGSYSILLLHLMRSRYNLYPWCLQIKIRTLGQGWLLSTSAGSCCLHVVNILCYLIYIWLFGTMQKILAAYFFVHVLLQRQVFRGKG